MVLPTAAALGAGAAIAVAAIPSSPGETITGCYETGTGTAVSGRVLMGPIGSLRVIDPSAAPGEASSCESLEQTITWNQAGPTGPPGPMGTAGQTGTARSAGTAGPAGPAGATGAPGPTGPAAPDTPSARETAIQTKVAQGSVLTSLTAGLSSGSGWSLKSGKSAPITLLPTSGQKTGSCMVTSVAVTGWNQVKDISSTGGAIPQAAACQDPVSKAGKIGIDVGAAGAGAGKVTAATSSFQLTDVKVTVVKGVVTITGKLQTIQTKAGTLKSAAPVTSWSAVHNVSTLSLGSTLSQ